MITQNALDFFQRVLLLLDDLLLERLVPNGFF